MPADFTSLATDSSLVDIIEIGDGSTLGADSNLFLTVEPARYYSTSIPEQLLDTASGEFIGSGSEDLISQQPSYPVAISRKMFVSGKPFAIYGESFGLNVGNGDTLQMSATEDLTVYRNNSYPINVSYGVWIDTGLYQVSAPPIAIHSNWSLGMGYYDTAKPSTGLNLGDGDVLNVSVDDELGLDQYKVFNPSTHRTITIPKATFNLTGRNVAILMKGKVIIDPLELEVQPNSIGIEYIRKFTLSTGIYTNQVYDININYRRLIQGKYTKDSANYYTLYVDKGADYFIDIDTYALGFDDITGWDFVGEFAKHATSITKYNMELSIVTSTLLKLTIGKEISNPLSTGKYLFDVTATKTNGTVVKVISGDVILNELVTRR